MFKSTLLSLAAVCAFSTVCAMEQNLDGIYLPEGKTLEQVQQAPKEAAYNTYHVLSDRLSSNALTYALACAKHPLCTASLLVRYPYARALAWATGRPHSLLDALLLRKQFAPHTSGEGYQQWFRRCGENNLAIIAQEAAVLCKPTEVTTIVEELHRNGVTQRVASNIGANIFQMLAARFKSVYNNPVFDILKTGQVIDYSDYGPNKNVPNLGGVNTTKHLQPLSKFFQEYDHAYNPERNKVTVLVSDNEAALTAAQKAGWAGVHYDVKTSNIEQLRDRLAKLGLPVQKK